MNPSALAELSVPGPCCPPAGLGLLPGALRAAPPLFPAAQHSVWHAAVLSSQVWSRRPGSLFVPAPHLDQAPGPGKWKWAGRGPRGDRRPAHIHRNVGVEGRESPVWGLGPQDTSELAPRCPPAIVVDSGVPGAHLGGAAVGVRSHSQSWCLGGLNSTRGRQGTPQDPCGLGPPAVTDHPHRTRRQRCPDRKDTCPGHCRDSGPGAAQNLQLGAPGTGSFVR